MRIATLAWIISLSWIASSSLAQDTSGAEALKRGKALLIGISKYVDTRWDDLDDVPEQLKALKTEFENHFDHARVELNNTGQEVGKLITDFLRDEGNKKDARLLIYYAGHGYTEPYHNLGKHLGFITGRDTAFVSRADDASYDKARPDAVSMDTIRTELANSKAASVIVIFDSCFSGTFFLSRSPDDVTAWSRDAIRQKMERPARSIITAGRKDEKIPASSPIPDLIIRALHGEADSSKSGVVLAGELKIFMEKQLRLNKAMHAPQGGSLPEYHEGEFLFRVVTEKPPVTDAVVKSLKEKASKGDLTATINLAGMLRAGSSSKMRFDAEALDLYRTAALKGNPTGQYALGLAYRDGVGMRKNEKEAVKFFQKAAEAGLPAAQAALADMHERGGGGLPYGNYKEAARLFGEAAAQGDAYAMSRLGRYYYRGYGGLKTDQTKAVELFKKAAAQGNGFAMAYLGYAYLNGRGGLSQSKDLARQYFQNSAAAGDGFGQLNLAYMHEVGWGGLQPDKVEALRLYRLAANQGYGWAQDQIDRIVQSPPRTSKVQRDQAAFCWWDEFISASVCN
ncbi:caspase family protein [Bradyrhizobium yuanmingense]|uniref:caspase family protein n=1 Tax=Bradyrhizobium yuanmingense TaxID=108015 RepID=UPI0023B9330E|nr:caspase family protein [Bradyrhizobium yuanmingense]MDF0584172.1 caspase family protein [Bradyrhizobium yuanmingense]